MDPRRSVSFCAWTFLPGTPEVLVVTDATKDGRFLHNSLVTGPPSIRFYAGAPIIANDHTRLAFCCFKKNGNVEMNYSLRGDDYPRTFIE